MGFTSTGRQDRYGDDIFVLVIETPTMVLTEGEKLEYDGITEGNDGDENRIGFHARMFHVYLRASNIWYILWTDMIDPKYRLQYNQ